MSRYFRTEPPPGAQPAPVPRLHREPETAYPCVCGHAAADHDGITAATLCNQCEDCTGYVEAILAQTCECDHSSGQVDGEVCRTCAGTGRPLP